MTGDRTKIHLNDITVVGETDGDSLVVTAEGNVTASGVTGGGAGDSDTSVWDPNIPPVSGYISGSTEDDEFDDESFDTGLWTEFDVASTQTVVENEHGIQLSTTSANHIQGIYQPAPAGADWSFTTFVGVPWDRSGNIRAGIMLIQDVENLSTSQVELWSNFRGGAGYGWQCIYHTDYDSWGTDDYNSVGGDRPYSQYLRFRRDGTNWYFDWSDDGRGWTSNEYQRVKRWNVTGIGVGHKLDISSQVVFFPFARFLADSSKSQILSGDRIKIWRV